MYTSVNRKIDPAYLIIFWYNTAMRESEGTIPFKQFQHLPDEDIQIGMMVGPLKPSKLYVSQDWIDDTKLGIALKELSTHQGPLVIPLYIHRLRFANGGTHRIMVIADYHHRTLVWDSYGLPIYGEIVATSIPERLRRSNILPFSWYRRSYETRI